MINFMKKLTILTIICTIILILLGTCIRLTNSGLACPDWPLCYGFWLPTTTKIASLPGIQYTFNQVVYEWSHRFFAGIVIGILVLLLFLSAFILWIRIRNRPTFTIVTLSFLCIVFLFFEALLGSLTVFKQNSSNSVSIHLLTSILFLGVLIMIYMYMNHPLFPFRKKAYETPHQVYLQTRRRYYHTAMNIVPVHKKVQKLYFFMIMLTMTVFYSGTMTTVNGASLALPELPFFHGYWMLVDVYDPLIYIEYSHYLFIAFDIILVLYTVYYIGKYFEILNQVYNNIVLVAWLYIFQIYIGAILIYYKIPFIMAVFHVFMSLSIIITLFVGYWKILLYIRINRIRRDEPLFWSAERERLEPYYYSPRYPRPEDRGPIKFLTKEEAQIQYFETVRSIVTVLLLIVYILYFKYRISLYK